MEQAARADVRRETRRARHLGSAVDARDRTRPMAVVKVFMTANSRRPPRLVF